MGNERDTNALPKDVKAKADLSQPSAIAPVSSDAKQEKTTSSKKKLNLRLPPRRHVVKALKVTGVVLAIAVIGFGGGWLGAKMQVGQGTVSTEQAQRIVLDEQSNLISSIATEVGQSVVSVNVTTNASVPSFWGGGRTVEQQSAGTGVILTSDGLILTNRHVVPTGTTSVSVILSDGTEFDADVVARTGDGDSLDVAFLQAKGLGSRQLKPAKLGKSSDMRVGDSVVAIGNALGQFQNTVTTGIISGYGRSVQASSGGTSVENLDDLFQTDASINSGNSGGPLVNLHGEVIAINTAVASGAENIGFAIPIDNISGLIASVKETGEIKRPFLGVVYVSLTDDIAKELELSVSRGAYIPKSETYGQDTIVDGSAADKAGVQEGDVIVKLDDTTIDERTSLGAALNKYSPGDTVTLTINRDGETLQLTAVLGERPND